MLDMCEDEEDRGFPVTFIFHGIPDCDTAGKAVAGIGGAHLLQGLA